MQQYCLQTYASTVLCIEWKMVPVMLMYEKAALPMNVTAEHVSQAMEFAALYAADEQKLRYLEEHGECLIREKALKKLRV